jgi:hypothetical protein
LTSGGACALAGAGTFVSDCAKTLTATASVAYTLTVRRASCTYYSKADTIFARRCAGALCTARASRPCKTETVTILANVVTYALAGGGTFVSCDAKAFPATTRVA